LLFIIAHFFLLHFLLFFSFTASPLSFTPFIPFLLPFSLLRHFPYSSLLLLFSFQPSFPPCIIFLLSPSIIIPVFLQSSSSSCSVTFPSSSFFFSVVSLSYSSCSSFFLRILLHSLQYLDPHNSMFSIRKG
jgi:hypothetical protein